MAHSLEFFTDLVSELDLHVNYCCLDRTRPAYEPATCSITASDSGLRIEPKHGSMLMVLDELFSFAKYHQLSMYADSEDNKTFIMLF